MEQAEFNKKHLRTEDSGHIYIDVRPFGSSEGKAVLFYLQETLFAVGNKTKAENTKIQKIVVICEPTTKLPKLVNSLVREINNQCQPPEIRPQHRETSE